MRWHTGRGAEDGHSPLLEQLARVVARLWAAYLGIVEEASAARSDTRLVDAVHRVGTRSLSSWRDGERARRAPTSLGAACETREVLLF